MSKRPKVPKLRPRLLFVGDPHSDFRCAIRVAQRYEPEALILLGDLQAKRPLEVELSSILDLTQVWFVHGNHDTDSEADHDNLWGSALADRNLHCRVVEIAGFRVAGLGGVFRESIWAPPLEPSYHSAKDRLKVVPERERWRGGLSLKHRSTIFPEDLAVLARQKADVLVCHEALGGHRYGWPSLNGLAKTMGVQVAVHGHLHQDIDYAAEGRLPAGSSVWAYGVAPDSFLVWPRVAGEFDLVEGGL